MAPERKIVTFAELLDRGHQAGLKSIATELLQAPLPDNDHTAICRAVVTFEAGTFSGIGDASPTSVAKHLVPHLTRMSETRAIARALRFGLNVDAVAREELGVTGQATVTPVRRPPASPVRPTSWGRS